MKKKSVQKNISKYLDIEGMNEEEDCDDLSELE
jgi:hypothetical protein